VIWRALGVALILTAPLGLPAVLDAHWTMRAVASLAALGVFGTWVANVLAATAAGRISATAASATNFIVPVVALALAARGGSPIHSCEPQKGRGRGDTENTRGNLRVSEPPWRASLRLAGRADFHHGLLGVGVRRERVSWLSIARRRRLPDRRVVDYNGFQERVGQSASVGADPCVRPGRHMGRPLRETRHRYGNGSRRARMADGRAAKTLAVILTP
jgi:hypothetical protein